VLRNKGLIVKRKFNVPPPPPSTVKRFDKTASARFEANVDELEHLLNRRYGASSVPMKTISYVIRKAIIKKIRELKEHV
jgi:hypothetical protein